MANPPLVLWVDPLANRLVADWRVNVPAPKPVFKQGDEVPIIIRKVNSQYSQYGMMEEIPWEGAATLTVGNRNAQPLGGYFTLSYEDSTSDEILHNATAKEVEMATNSMPDIAIDGGVRVTQLYGDAYKIAFNRNGNRAALTGNGTMLMPQSLVNVTTVKAGSPTEPAVFLLVLRQDDYAETASFTTESQCVAGVAQYDAYTWDFFLSKQPKGGFFELQINDDTPIQIPAYASETEIQLLVGENYTVGRMGNWSWRIVSNDNSPFDISVDDADIASFSGIYGVISFDGSPIIEAMSASPSADAFIEIVEEVGSDDRVILNKPCTILSKVNR